MASDVFLVRCTDPDFERTVLNTVSVDDESGPEEITSASPVRVWGIPVEADGNDYFGKMGRGGLVLFRQNDVYIGIGEIGVTASDPEHRVTEAVWDDFEAENVFTLDSIEQVSVPAQAVNRIFGYSDSYSPGRILKVADNRVTNSADAIRLALRKYTDKHGPVDDR